MTIVYGRIDGKTQVLIVLQNPDRSRTFPNIAYRLLLLTTIAYICAAVIALKLLKPFARQKYRVYIID